MALAQPNSTAPHKEFIPHGIGDAATRGAWCAAYVASARANSSMAFCEPHEHNFVAGSESSDTAVYDNETYIIDANAATGQSVDPGASNPINVYRQVL
jgi:hypothetical protein